MMVLRRPFQLKKANGLRAITVTIVPTKVACLSLSKYLTTIIQFQKNAYIHMNHKFFVKSISTSQRYATMLQKKGATTMYHLKLFPSNRFAVNKVKKK